MKKDHGLGSAKRSPYRWARKPKLSLGDLSLQFEQVRSDCSAHQMHQWERPTGQTAEAKRTALADCVDTVPAMTNARAWKILPGLYLMAVSCTRGSPVRNVLDMTKWPRTGPDSGNRERDAAAHVKS